MQRALIWFRNDLRIDDNPTLRTAARESNHLIAVYIIDPQQYRQLEQGFPKTGRARFSFLSEALRDLHQQLDTLGCTLLIRVGPYAAELTAVVREYEIEAVYAQRLTGYEEQQAEREVRAQLEHVQIPLRLYWTHLLFHPDDVEINFTQTPATFKTFRKRLGRRPPQREPEDAPPSLSGIPSQEAFSLPRAEELIPEEHPEPGQIAYAGGETAARQRLHYYLWDSQLITRYKWTRNQSLGGDFSSKLSPYLAHGCMSPLRIYQQVKAFEREVKRNISTSWLIFEVKWREFFHWLSEKHGHHMFLPGGIKQREQSWKYDLDLFDRWRMGRTGIPFVDAHMRELNQTGFMSNRGRVNCSSFLAYDYGLDWTWGAAWFESRLIDYNVASNWLNWNMQATELRYTNPIWQNKKYDKKGEYVKTWIPEISELSAPELYAPFLAEDTVEDYPRPSFLSDRWNWALKRLQ